MARETDSAVRECVAVNLFPDAPAVFGVRWAAEPLIEGGGVRTMRNEREEERESEFGVGLVSHGRVISP